MESQNFLVMRDFGNQSPPGVEKVRADGIRMYCEARYVIVLDEEGNVVERINRSITYTGNFLVVLAPVVYMDQKINLSVVLEIGLSRSVPYQQFEKNFADGKFAVKGRRPVAKLSNETIISLLPIISQSLKLTALEETKHWKKVTYIGERNPNRSRNVEWKCGIYASVPKDEEIICFAIYLLDLETRSVYLDEKAFFIKFWLRRYKHIFYTRNQIRSFAGAKKVADMIMTAKYPAHHLEIVMSSLSFKNKELLELCIRAFSDEPKNGEEYKEAEELLAAPKPPAFYESLRSKFVKVSGEIKTKWRLHGYVWEGRNEKRTTHAKNSLRFEIGLDENDRKNHIY